MTPVFHAQVKKGSLYFDESSKFAAFLAGMEGQRVNVTVQKPGRPRSNQENRYYWGVVIKTLSDHTGYSDDEMHDALRMLFLKDHTESIPTIRSTAALTTVEFEEYMTKIRAWASQELSVYVPEPNEVEA